jgi:superoxide dismutase, Fe-Mn family
MAVYELPDLPYDYAALEPHYSARQVELHHDKHHATYVKGANDTLEQFDQFRTDGASNQQVLRGLERSLAFNVSGHLLHSVFWPTMSPNGGGKPEGELAAAIEDGFGSFDNLKSQLNLATTTLFGSGWGALVWEPLAGRLMVEQVYDHQSNMSPSNLPIVNWERVAARLEHARGALNASLLAMA